MSYHVVTFYKFTPLTDLDTLKASILSTMDTYHIKGTIILAEEGINGTLSGLEAPLQACITWLQALPAIQTLTLKWSACDFNPFDKAKVKIRKEAVTMGIPHLDPNEETGVHLDADAWNTLLQRDDVIVIDTRNDYEIALGTFEGAISPHTDNFRDFPEYVTQHLSAHKDKKIAMYCTGGVRCEKSTAYLLQQGFPSVYQLDGGILKYLETVSPESSLWQGDCFVFDNRVALDKHLAPLPAGTLNIEFKNQFKRNKTHAET